MDIKCLIFTAFQECRKAQDRAVGHVSKCKIPPINCGGSSDTETLTKQLAVAKKLSNALNKVASKASAALTSAELDPIDKTKDATEPAKLKCYQAGTCSLTRQNQYH